MVDDGPGYGTATPGLMQLYGLKSYDAVHAATALAVDADGMLALDTEFARIPERVLTIHTPTAKVPRMRAIRGATPS